MTPDIYSEDKILERLKDHPNWHLDGDGELHADFRFKSFVQVMMFTNAVAHLAQAARHHPDMYIHDYKQLTLSLMTHSAGGITDKDFALIAQIDSLPLYD